jgi:hypothetical protein
MVHLNANQHTVYFQNGTRLRFPNLSHRLSLNKVTEALTRALQSVNERKKTISVANWNTFNVANTNKFSSPVSYCFHDFFYLLYMLRGLKNSSPEIMWWKILGEGTKWLIYGTSCILTSQLQIWVWSLRNGSFYWCSILAKFKFMVWNSMLCVCYHYIQILWCGYCAQFTDEVERPTVWYTVFIARSQWLEYGKRNEFLE